MVRRGGAQNTIPRQSLGLNTSAAQAKKYVRKEALLSLKSTNAKPLFSLKFSNKSQHAVVFLKFV